MKSCNVKRVIPVVVTIAASLVACATPPIRHLYDGPMREPSELAFVAGAQRISSAASRFPAAVEIAVVAANGVGIGGPDLSWAEREGVGVFRFSALAPGTNNLTLAVGVLGTEPATRPVFELPRTLDPGVAYDWYWGTLSGEEISQWWIDREPLAVFREPGSQWMGVAGAVRALAREETLITWLGARGEPSYDPEWAIVVRDCEWSAGYTMFGDCEYAAVAVSADDLAGMRLLEPTSIRIEPWAIEGQKFPVAE